MSTMKEITEFLAYPEWGMSWRHRVMALTFVVMAVWCAETQRTFELPRWSRLKRAERWLMNAAFFLGFYIEGALGLHREDSVATLGLVW